MTKVWIDIVGARAAAKKEGLLTAGMVGVPVEFSFSPEWAGLNLLAVFRAGEVKKDYEIKEGRSVIPAEVMVQPGQVLCIGVEGRSKSGDLVIPTVWAEVGRILDGAYAANDPALAPTPSQYERFMAEVEQLDEKLLEALYQAKQSGEFDGTSVTHQWVGTALKVTSASGTSQAELKGEPGHTPVKGVDYYTEAEKQEFARQVADQFGDEVVYITIDEATRMASHDAEQIKLLAEAGKTVLLKREEKIYQLCNTREGSFAYFNDRSNGVYIRLVRIADTGEVIYDTGGTVYYDAVRCGVQPLTEEQKAQARENLGIQLPVFDLAQMGLPALDMSQPQVYVEGDFTQVCLAVGSGPIALTFPVDLGGAVTSVSIVAGGMCVEALGAWQISHVCVFQGTVILVCFDFMPEGLTVQMQVLSTLA